MCWYNLIKWFKNTPRDKERYYYIEDRDKYYIEGKYANGYANGYGKKRLKRNLLEY